MLATSVVSAPSGAQYVPVDIFLSQTAKRLYEALRATGEAVRDHRGYHPGVTVVTYFAPLEAVAMAIGVTRQTVYNRLPELEKAGLVTQRGHFTTYRGQTRSDGSLWAVRLKPGERAKAPEIGHDYLKGSYRDLGEDIRQGRTAWSLLQSKPVKTEQVDIQWILSFAITSTSKRSIADDCKRERGLELETLLDVPYVPLAERGEMVDKAARAIGQTLGTEARSLNMWRWLVWTLLRLQEVQGRDYWYQVYLLLQRAGVDHRERACRNAGGLFVSRLKASQIWDELRLVPLIRVGLKPNQG